MRILEKDCETTYSKALSKKELVGVAEILTRQIRELEDAENEKAAFVKESGSMIKAMEEEVKELASTYRKAKEEVTENLNIFLDEESKERVYFKPGDSKELFRRPAKDNDLQKAIEFPEPKLSKPITRLSDHPIPSYPAGGDMEKNGESK